jgi:MFS family permease
MASLYSVRGPKLNRLMVLTVVGPAFLLLGYNNALAGGLLNLPNWIHTFPQIDAITTTGAQQAYNSTIQGKELEICMEFHHELSYEGTVVASYTLGCFIGAFSCIFLGDKIGRIRTIALACIVHIVGAAIQGSAFSLAQLVIGRIVLGLGYGTLSATVPMWQTECSISEHRGKNVVMEGFFASLGLLTVAVSFASLIPCSSPLFGLNTF